MDLHPAVVRGGRCGKKSVGIPLTPNSVPVLHGQVWEARDRGCARKAAPERPRRAGTPPETGGRSSRGLRGPLRAGKDPSWIAFCPWSTTGPRPPHLTLVRASDYGSILHDPAGERTDALLELGDRIAELERSIGVAQAEIMRLIVECDEARGWGDAGFPNCAEWLAWRTGMGRTAARERV